NDRGNVARYELRYNNPNLAGGKWTIYQRGGSPTDNVLVNDIQMPAGFDMNGWNDYKIVAGGGYITYFVNDTEIAKVASASNGFGGFGFGGYDATYDIANVSLV